MDVDKILRSADGKKQEIDSAGPLPEGTLCSLRNDSIVRYAHEATAIEGNTLTLSETVVVLENGITIGGKTIREHLEVLNIREGASFGSGRQTNSCHGRICLPSPSPPIPIPLGHSIIPSSPRTSPSLAPTVSRPCPLWPPAGHLPTAITPRPDKPGACTSNTEAKYKEGRKQAIIPETDRLDQAEPLPQKRRRRRPQPQNPREVWPISARCIWTAASVKNCLTWGQEQGLSITGCGSESASAK